MRYDHRTKKYSWWIINTVYFDGYNKEIESLWIDPKSGELIKYLFEDNLVDIIGRPREKEK